ncbi:MAG TPA: hypothetical protein PKE65_07925, partial [Rhizobiaceae bacterium]|nr:hypothetical protein [Rhizobiaceae bacterium]
MSGVLTAFSAYCKKAESLHHRNQLCLAHSAAAIEDLQVARMFHSAHRLKERSIMIESHPINPSQGINVGSLDTYGTGLQTLNLMKSADGWRVIDITMF